MKLAFYPEDACFPTSGGPGLCKPVYVFDSESSKDKIFRSEECKEEHLSLDHWAIPVFQTLYMMDLPDLMAHIRFGPESSYIDTREAEIMVIVFSTQPIEHDAAKWSDIIKSVIKSGLYETRYPPCENSGWIHVRTACCCVIQKGRIESIDSNFFLYEFKNTKQILYEDSEKAKDQFYRKAEHHRFVENILP